MCGIAGYIGRAAVSYDRIGSALSLMSNRGPDHKDYKVYEQGGMNVVLLHSRLSILDLDPRSHQPFSIGNSTLIFNGEIYNYLELREELKAKGIPLRTTSDTEVLLHYYLLYGQRCIEYFEGMWSFAIFDESKGLLFLSRDRFAEKPLYCYQSKEGFYFGSEVKFIKALSGEVLSVNQRQLLRYMVNGYKSLYKTEDTFFEGIKEVPFATNLTIDSNFNERSSRYWVPQHKQQSMTLEESVEAFRERLLESVRIRLRADVPLAFCLSGGIDSASIVSIAAKCFDYDVATFSIVDSDERYDERDNIQATLDDLKCKHTIIETSHDGFFERLSELIDYHDAPLYTISYYIHSFLSESIAKHGYRVVCSGTGADEMVTGYYDHFNLYLYEMRNSQNYLQYLEDWKQHVGCFVRNPYLKQPELYFNNPRFRNHIYLNNDVFSGYMNENFTESFVEEVYCNSLLHNRMMNEMFHEGTRVVLHEDDLNSMRYSIENRSPYLDSKLFEVSYSIPTEYLIQDGYGKYILREAVKGILNNQVRLDRQKKGFNAAITSLVNFKDPSVRDYILSDSPVYNLVDRKKIEAIIPTEPLPNSMSKFWFYFLNAKVFLEQN